MGFWKGVGLALLAGAFALAVGFLLPIFGTTSARGPMTRNLNNAKQWATAARIYCDDHGGRFPMQLSELVPEFVDSDSAANLLFEVREDGEKRAYAKQDWLYFGAYFDEKNPPPILIASPQATGFNGKPPKRIVIHGDATGEIVDESTYQAELRKTIEAMHNRFDAAKPAP